jgi:hypothetical protein
MFTILIASLPLMAPPWTDYFHLSLHTQAQFGTLHREKPPHPRGGKDFSSRNVLPSQRGDVPCSGSRFPSRRCTFYPESFEVKAKSFEICAQSFEVKAKSFEICAQSFELRAKSFEICAQSFEFRAKSFKITAQSFEHRAKSFKIGAQSFKLKAKSFKHGAQSSETAVLNIRPAALFYKTIYKMYNFCSRKNIYQSFSMNAIVNKKTGKIY